LDVFGFFETLIDLGHLGMKLEPENALVQLRPQRTRNKRSAEA
jgi:hypothetical protein